MQNPNNDTLSDTDLETQIKHREQVMSNILSQLRPWLFEFGTWIFGGLLAFNLLIVASVILLAAEAHGLLIYISLAAFVCALPVNVSGLFALRLIKDMNEVAIDDKVKQAFQDAQVPMLEESLSLPKDADSPATIRVNIGLRYAMRLVAMSGILTMLGLVTSLWYISWWLAVIFLIMAGFSFYNTMQVVRRLMRPEVEGNPELAQRYREVYEAQRQRQRDRKQGQ